MGRVLDVFDRLSERQPLLLRTVIIASVGIGLLGGIEAVEGLTEISMSQTRAVVTTVFSLGGPLAVGAAAHGQVSPAAEGERRGLVKRRG